LAKAEHYAAEEPRFPESGRYYGKPDCQASETVIGEIERVMGIKNDA